MESPFFLIVIGEFFTSLSSDTGVKTRTPRDYSRQKNDIDSLLDSKATLQSINKINKMSLMSGNRNCSCIFATHKMDTLDGSDYYVCVHGKRIKRDYFTL